MPRSPNQPCTRCGTLLWPSKATSGRQICHPCRRLHPVTQPEQFRCQWCAVRFAGRRRGRQIPQYCSLGCAGRAFSDSHGAPTGGYRASRRARERVAPGLTARQRAQLGRKWRRQGRACAYCGTRSGDTVDHVVPLVRGGTNYEGNLAPACRSCNSAKCGRLLTEWRMHDSTRLRLLQGSVRGEAA